MTNKIIDCDKIKNKLFEKLKEEIIDKSFSIACLYLENDKNSISYFKQIKRQAEILNVKVKEYIVEENEEKIINQIQILNEENNSNGILFLNPTNTKLNYEKINKSIVEKKNIDPMQEPCTVSATLEILESIEKAKEQLIVVIGRGKLVGMPLYNILNKYEYNVIQCHSKTKNKRSITSKADIIISAVGKPHFLKKEDIKKDAIIIDIGISYKENRIYGDVDLEDVLKKVKLITKTPGGVGILTTSYLFKNLIDKN